MIQEVSRAFNEQGVKFFEAGQLEKARECFQKSIQIYPHEAIFHKNLAEVFLKNNDFGKAAECYQTAIKLAERPDFKLKLAEIYWELKNPDAAFEIEPGNREILNLILNRIFNHYQGECLKCGQCCLNMILVHQEKVIKTEEEFKRLCAEKPQFSRWLPVRDKEGILRFNCRWLEKDRTCKFYEKRDESCKNYPDFRTATLKPGCGFQRKIDFDFSLIKNSQLREKIIEYSQKIGLEISASLSHQAKNF